MVSLAYKMYVSTADNGEELWEETPEKHPLIYCHGTGMMLPKFEEELAGKEPGDEFDFRLAKEDAYGEYDPAGQLTLDKTMFYNGDNEFDEDRVIEGNIIPMTTTDGQIVNAQVIEVNENTVVIDLNHPLAGEDLHFTGIITHVRKPTEREMNAIRKRQCGGCCGGVCNGEKECENNCESRCGNCNQEEVNNG